MSDAQQKSPGRRAAAYWFADGIEETVFGSVMASLSIGAILYGLYAPKPWNKFDATCIIEYISIFVYAAVRLDAVSFLKSRLVYSRTGYAGRPEEFLPAAGQLNILSITAPEKPKQNVTRWGNRSLLFVALISFVTVPWRWQHSAPKWFGPALLAGLALTLSLRNRDSECPYGRFSTSVLALMGLPFLWLSVPWPVQAWFPVALGGLWMTAIGLGKLARHLRANPRSTAPEGGVA
jgi:hypothetical protein